MYKQVVVETVIFKVILPGFALGIIIASFLGCSNSSVSSNTDKIYITPQMRVFPSHTERHDYDC